MLGHIEEPRRRLLDAHELCRMRSEHGTDLGQRTDLDQLAGSGRRTVLGEARAAFRMPAKARGIRGEARASSQNLSEASVICQA